MALYVEVGTSAAVFGGFGIATSVYVLHLVIEARASAERASRLAEARSRLVFEVQTAEERVRARVAGELHDDVIQALLAARQDLSDTIHGRGDRLENAAGTLDAAIGKLRRTAVDLHPAVPSQIGLRAALERTVDELERRAGARHKLFIAGDIPRSVEGTVYGLSRELLANASQHAEASLVHASIACGPTSITVTVVDDGRGLAVERRAEALAEGHLGLASWEYRLANQGGSLTISTGPEQGTTVTAVIPRNDLAGVS
jgi:two-component system NarL family sensor kinase